MANSCHLPQVPTLPHLNQTTQSNRPTLAKPPILAWPYLCPLLKPIPPSHLHTHHNPQTNPQYLSPPCLWPLPFNPQHYPLLKLPLSILSVLYIIIAKVLTLVLCTSPVDSSYPILSNISHPTPTIDPNSTPNSLPTLILCPLGHTHYPCCLCSLEPPWNWFQCLKTATYLLAPSPHPSYLTPGLSLMPNP